jgi:HK97 family phage major capsid protein
MQTRKVPGVSEEIREICRDEEVRTFLGQVRANRAVQNATYTIPTVMLPMIVAAIEKNSKLLKHVNVTALRGNGVLNILAEAPEAVWTDTVGKINEVNLNFYQIQTFGSKLGAYVPVPNPYLEDSDENLAAIIVDQLGQAHGYALDKAILYGTGANMPVGIVTRLLATTQPTWWQTRMPAFTNVSTTNVGKVSAASVTGAALYKELMAKLGNIEEKYNAGGGDLFWAMKRSTWLKLQSELLSINAAGAVVTGAQMQMPIIGGTVEVLDFIPDNNIVGGYGSHYKLLHRRGLQIAESEHALFLEDAKVFRSTSRWDGIPLAGESFAAFSLSTTAVSGSIPFAPDVANEEEGG